MRNNSRHVLTLPIIDLQRYHAYREGAYFLPNDDKEQERLDLVHHVFRISLDGALFLAPISSDIKRALDIGTGTGIWAIDFADEFPKYLHRILMTTSLADFVGSAEVVGTDLSPIQRLSFFRIHFGVMDTDAVQLNGSLLICPSTWMTLKMVR